MHMCDFWGCILYSDCNSAPFCPPVDSCLTKLYVMAFTSGVNGGDTTATACGTHSIELQTSRHVWSLQLYNRPGEDTVLNKGDLWKIPISDFHFSNNSCVTISNISGVALTERNNDGWHIDSVVTLVKDTAGGVQVLTQDLDANRWVDGDNGPLNRRFELTLA